jgi:hypothetical protein
MTAFSFDRWRLLVGRHWAENKRKYILSMVAITSLLLFWFGFIIMVDQNYHLPDSMQHGTYFVCLFIIGSFYASQFFNDLGSQPRGINFLLTPASTLEKLACSLFYAVLLFFLFFTLAFYLADVLMVALANALQRSRTDAGETRPPSEVINLFFAKKHNADSVNISFYLVLAFFAVQSFFLLGSVYFSKYSFIKTAIALFVLFMAGLFLESYVMDALLPNGYHAGRLTTYLTVHGDGSGAKVAALPEWIGNTLNVVFSYAFPPLFWLATYYRLKEKEV